MHACVRVCVRACVGGGGGRGCEGDVYKGCVGDVYKHSNILCSPLPPKTPNPAHVPLLAPPLLACHAPFHALPRDLPPVPVPALRPPPPAPRVSPQARIRLSGQSPGHHPGVRGWDHPPYRHPLAGFQGGGEAGPSPPPPPLPAARAETRGPRPPRPPRAPTPCSHRSAPDPVRAAPPYPAPPATASPGARPLLLLLPCSGCSGCRGATSATDRAACP